jgi:5,6-dimethylbenzimidazole synthase/histidinol-phosphate aminotransferase
MNRVLKNEPTAIADNRVPANTSAVADEASDDGCTTREPNEAYHGGLNADELARYGLDVGQAIDFSSNILAHGPSPRVRAAAGEANLAAYPDRDCVALRKAIANRFSINESRILVGNGSCELIHLLARTLIAPGDSVIIVGPTFSEYQRASKLASAHIVECSATASNQFTVPVDKIESALEQAAATVLWICNPNNPTGNSVSEQQLLKWVRHYPETTFVIDESYIEFAEQAKSLLSHREPNLVVLRSMTKSYGIAGLRLGFAVASPNIHQRLCRQRVPWTVNAPAQAAGIAALHDDSFYSSGIVETRQAKRDLLANLNARGFTPLATDANYFLLPVEHAQQVRHALLADGIVVRDPVSNRRLAVALSKATYPTTSFTEPLCSLPLQPSAAHSSAAQTPVEQTEATRWDSIFCEQLGKLFRMRRDVRSFKRDAIAPEALHRWIEAACMAPSVGLSQPWKFVSINNLSRRIKVAQEFESQNQIAGKQFDSELAAKYRELKLAGLREAPEQIAVFIDPDPAQGRGLGRQTMPESVAYSVVAAIQNFWLAARSEGVGVGWVSILRPDAINAILEVPDHWQLIAYLCVGYPLATDVETPELESCGWENRGKLEEQWHQR